MMKRKIVLGIAGSSGSIYAKLLMDALSKYDSIEVGVVMSPNAITNWNIEIGAFDKAQYPFTFYEINDFMAPFASGSAKFEAMVICPCSMGVLGRISSGLSNNLMTRAADVILKENRKLILVPRETPFNLIHLENMALLCRAGATIIPAIPSFYSKPDSVEAVCQTVVDRILDHLELDNASFRWGSA